MTTKTNKRHRLFAAIAASALAASLGVFSGGAAHAQVSTSEAPRDTLTLSVGHGQLVNLPHAMTDLFVAQSEIADVQVRSATALYVFGKAAGQTTVYATDRAGNVVYSANVRVGNNLDSVSSMLDLAMPEASITATPMNGMILLTGTVASPADIEEAQQLVQAFVGEETQVISRLRTATPLQVNLQVKIAEVNRSVIHDIGANITTFDGTGGFRFGIGRGRSVGDGVFGPNGPLAVGNGVQNPSTTYTLPSGEQVTVPGVGVDSGDNRTTLAGLGSLLGLNILGAIDLAETQGLVNTLAEPNLTALSGETASFLAGGEFPIPLSQGLGAVSIEYKQYGVSLAFTPVVLANGRISMRIRPEVSELSEQGAISLNGYQIPGLTTRRAETTVELGSGQSFMIAGLLQNTHASAIDGTPGLGDIPVLGALFRSNRWRRNETELVIVVTPYLVQPVSADQIVLPTDGYRSPNDAERIFLGRTFDGETGARRPGPTMAPPQTVQPGMETGAAQPQQPVAGQNAEATAQSGGAAPGFSFNE